MPRHLIYVACFAFTLIGGFGKPSSKRIQYSSVVFVIITYSGFFISFLSFVNDWNNGYIKEFKPLPDKDFDY